MVVCVLFLLVVLPLQSTGTLSAPRKYCLPGEESCWPTHGEILQFSASIDGSQETCLGLKKFVHLDDPYAHVTICRPYNGLEPCSGENGKICDSSPFVAGAYYNDTYNMHACMTPYQFLNNRNYKKEWMAAFIVTANSRQDIQIALEFARKHSLGISVMSTGHELADRNAGPGPNSLLIRTTCFGDWNPYPDDVIEDYNGTLWTEGYVELGVGHTFGQNFWWNMSHSEGIYALAAKDTREMVGGTCHSVGIVGWTMGGGRGWTSPMYGIGVNQLLHVDMVTADGSLTSANFSHNPDLFWAVRGGGPGFGVITSMKLKLHKPRCRRSTEDSISGEPTMEDCYTIWKVNYEGAYKKDKTKSYVNHLLTKFSNWSIKHRTTWTSVVDFFYNKETNKYTVEIEGRYFAKQGELPDTYNSFIRTFKDTTDRKGDISKTTTAKYWCEIFPDPTKTNNCTNVRYNVGIFPHMMMILVNSSILHKNNDFISALLETWQPLCDKNPNSPCVNGYQFRGDMPAIDPKTGLGVHATPSAVSYGFNSASFLVFAWGQNSKIPLTSEQQISFLHFNLAPKLYKYSNASYFNEAEYTLKPGHWERRFWGKEKHSKVLQIKKKYDPELMFSCYHCIGSEDGTEPLKLKSPQYPKPSLEESLIY